MHSRLRKGEPRFEDGTPGFAEECRQGRLHLFRPLPISFEPGGVQAFSAVTDLILYSLSRAY